MMKRDCGILKQLLEGMGWGRIQKLLIFRLLKLFVIMIERKNITSSMSTQLVVLTNSKPYVPSVQIQEFSSNK
jgi:uncharacterized membrane protein